MTGKYPLHSLLSLHSRYPCKTFNISLQNFFLLHAQNKYLSNELGPYSTPLAQTFSTRTSGPQVTFIITSINGLIHVHR